MTIPQAFTLTLGTGLIVGLCYAIAAPAPHLSQPAPRVATHTVYSAPREDFAEICRMRAEEIRGRCGTAWPMVVESPFVITGDLSADQLTELMQSSLLPTMRALQLDYFDRDPTVPVTVIILSSAEAYRSTLEALGHARQAEYSGLYHREERLIVLNLATGPGTLAHELTHALAHADFPEMPEWFDEGLASLHEESEFTLDGSRLRGRENWRRRFLDEAMQRDCWKSVGRLLDEPFGDPDVAALDYALARDLCLYLQERGLLQAFYRKCRGDIAQDPTGQQSLTRLFPRRTLYDIDQEFRAWLQQRK